MFGSLVDLVTRIREEGLESVFKRYYSIYEGEVVDNTDEDRLGRVSVRVPVVSDLPLQNLALPFGHVLANKNKGSFMPPEVGDQVWVMFRQGDLRFPMWMGGLHANPKGVSETPEAFFHEDGVPKVRGFVSKHGHQVLIDEIDGKEKITLKTGGGHYFILDDSAGAEAIFLIHKGGNQIQMDSKGSIKAFDGAGNTLSLDAEKSVASLVSAGGSIIALDKGVVVSESSGKTSITLNDAGAQTLSSGDAVTQAGSATLNVGSFVVDTKGAQIKAGNGKVYMGTPAAEVIDLLIQALTAALTDPAPAVCAVGPVSPLSGLMRTNFTLIQTLLLTLKTV
jgi:hypothetical protein